jgi:ParB family chromosome partitioning protein
MNKLRLRKLTSDPQLVPGIIEDIEMYRIIEPSFLLRLKHSELNELASSIKQKGLLQPIVVRSKEAQFEIVAGNRRYNACKILQWRKITCHVVELDDKEAFEVSLTENVQRKTLNPLEEARAFKSYVSDFGWGGVSDLALRLGKSSSYITRRIRLLELPSDVLDSITDSVLGTSIAEELCSVKDKSKQSELAEMISRRHLSLKETREMLKFDDDGDEDNEYTHTYSLYQNQGQDNIQRAHRIMDKSILLLKVAMNRLGTLIENTEDDWIIHEILMQHNSMLHVQIDLLIKEKRKYNHTMPVILHNA